MTHALTIPDFSSHPAGCNRIPFHADPVLAAIERHSEAWAVVQVARRGADSVRTDDELHTALNTMLGTACATRAGAFCLIRHLRWWLSEEAPNAAAYGDAWAVAQAREADLSKFLGVEPIERRPVALPSGRMLAPIAKQRLALTAAGSVRAVVGDALAALILVAGGAFLTGFATLL